MAALAALHLCVAVSTGLLPHARSNPLRCPAARASAAEPTGLGLTPPAEIVAAAVRALRPAFADIDEATEFHLRRVLNVFRKHNVGPHHFAGVDGYGNGDLGREALDSIYAELMGAEAALVRVQIFSGTHAIACALFGVLRPGDEMLTVSGASFSPPVVSLPWTPVAPHKREVVESQTQTHWTANRTSLKAQGTGAPSNGYHGGGWILNIWLV